MVEQKPTPEFRTSSSGDEPIDNVEDMDLVQLAGDESNLMAEANISELDVSGEDIVKLMVELDKDSLISMTRSRIEQPASQSATLRGDRDYSRILQKLEDIEFRLLILENLIDDALDEESLRSHQASEISVNSIEEEYSDDWYAKNPDWHTDLKEIPPDEKQ